MFTKLFNGLAAISLATVLALGGVVGYLFGSGHLSADRLQIMARLMRGELDDLPGLRGSATAEGQSGPGAASQPRPAGPDSETFSATTEDELRRARQRQHLEMLELERAARDLQAQRRLLDQVLQHVMQEQERLAEQRTEWLAQREKLSKAAVDEGFQKELALVSGLQPRAAKEYILRLWQKQPADAVRLLHAMEENRALRILEQFKTPEELTVQSNLLEGIRLHGAGSSPSDADRATESGSERERGARKLPGGVAPASDRAG